MTFRVYDADDDTGAVLWTETLDVSVDNGFYITTLGQTTAIPDTVFDGSTRYLGVTVGDDMATEELAPRLEVTSVAYAIKAGVAENATGALTPESISLAGGSTTLNADGSISAGAATIATDGTITLGAATINPDGSIEVGNTTIGADGSITVNSAPVIAADGTVDSGSIGGTTLDSLEAAGCATGQLPQFDAVNGWSCFTPVAGTVYGAGTGLNIDASSVFSVDPALVQTRVMSTCIAGEAIRSINEDGSVICETDDDTIYTAGAGVDIAAGVISLTDATDDDTTYLAGTGLALDGATNTFNVDQAQIEAWAVGVDTNTTYTAGTGIDISGGVVSLVDTVDDDTTYSAGTGINISAGGVVSLIDATDNDTTYSNGVGLDLAAGVFSVNQTQVEAWASGVDSDTTYLAGTALALDTTTNTFNVDQTQVEAWATDVIAASGAYVTSAAGSVDDLTVTNSLTVQGALLVDGTSFPILKNIVGEVWNDASVTVFEAGAKNIVDPTSGYVDVGGSFSGSSLYLTVPLIPAGLLSSTDRVSVRLEWIRECLTSDCDTQFRLIDGAGTLVQMGVHDNTGGELIVTSTGGFNLGAYPNKGSIPHVEAHWVLGGGQNSSVTWTARYNSAGEAYGSALTTAILDPSGGLSLQLHRGDATESYRHRLIRAEIHRF